MTIPNTNVSFSSINLELGRAANAQLDIGYANARNLAGVPNGSISLSSFKSKSAIAPLMFTPAYNYSDIPGYTGGEIPFSKGIWPAGSGETGQGWVGHRFVTDASSGYLTAYCDDTCEIYVNNVYVASVGMAHQQQIVALKPNVQNSISVYVDDIPGGARHLYLVISRSNGNNITSGDIIVATDSYWVSTPT